MDIEKLKAIIRLANNNPNENEANLAARKACKILAENDFSIFNGRVSSRSSSKESEVSVSDIFEEMMKQQRAAENKRRERERREADAARKAEEAQRNQRKRPNPEKDKHGRWNPFYGFEDNFNPFRTTRDESGFRRVWVDDPDIFEQETRERQEQKEVRDKELYQRCSRCRNLGWGPKNIDSLYGLGYKEFICHVCLGTKYNKSDSSYKKSETKKKCPRCQADIYYDFKEKVFICDNIICSMIITEQEWVNIGK